MTRRNKKNLVGNEHMKEDAIFRCRKCLEKSIIGFQKLRGQTLNALGYGSVGLEMGGMPMDHSENI